jgi:hypothetical protein
VTNSDIAELCRRIYRQHQRALDLIFEHRPDLQQGIYNLLLGMIDQENGVSLDFSSKAYVRFSPDSWDDIAELRQGQGWTQSGRMLLFEFSNQESLKLRLVIGPGPEQTRRMLFDFARQNQGGSMRPGNKLWTKWNTVWQKEFLGKGDYDGAEVETLQALLREKWKKFLSADLPKLEPMFGQVFRQDG